MIIVLILLSMLVIGLAYVGRHSKDTADEPVSPETLKLQFLQTIDGFNPALTCQGLPGFFGVAIDPTTEQFAIAIPGNKPRLYHFSQLVSAEVDRDGETLTSTNGKVNTTGMGIATALLGPIGIAAGAKTSSQSNTRSMITRLSLKLYVDDLHCPRFEIPFITNGAYDVAAPATRQAIALAEEWYGRFWSILLQVERQGANLDRSKAVLHDGPLPSLPQRSWSDRVFGA